MVGSLERVQVAGFIVPPPSGAIGQEMGPAGGPGEPTKKCTLYTGRR